MKKLSTLILIVLAFLLTSNLNAQTLGVRGGLNMSKQLAKDDDDTISEDFDNLIGFHIGLILEVPISDVISVESGVMVTTQGFKIEEKDDSDSFESKGILYYINIPLTLKGDFSLRDGMDLYGIAGPYVGLGINGKIKTTIIVMGEKMTLEDDIRWGSDEVDQYKRLDVGLTLGVGVEMSALQIGLAYDLGLANIYPGVKDNGERVKNRSLRLTMGYFISR